MTKDRKNGIGGRLSANGIAIQVKEDGSFKTTFRDLKRGKNEIRFEGEADAHVPTTRTIIATRLLTNAERIAEYRRDAEKLSYAMFSKNPDRYKGTHIAVLGRIFTIQESGNSTVVQVNLSYTGGSLFNFEDQIIVTYDQKTDFVKDSFVWICGTIEGSQTYTSVAGYTITVPHIAAEYLGKFEGEVSASPSAPK